MPNVITTCKCEIREKWPWEVRWRSTASYFGTTYSAVRKKHVVTKRKIKWCNAENRKNMHLRKWWSRDVYVYVLGVVSRLYLMVLPQCRRKAHGYQKRENKNGTVPKVVQYATMRVVVMRGSMTMCSELFLAIYEASSSLLKKNRWLPKGSKTKWRNVEVTTIYKYGSSSYERYMSTYSELFRGHILRFFLSTG